MQATQAAFELKDVTKDYVVWRRLRPTTARGIAGVTYAAPRGAIVGLLGLNGAGKTTAMKLLVGLARPTSGSVRVLGGDPAEASVRARIGYVPELPYLPRQLSSLGLLEAYGRLSGLAGRHLRNQAARALALTGLEAKAREPLRFLSKGQTQRLALAQALLHGPELLFLDEPMSGLDPKGVKEMRDLLARLRDDGATICLNSHQIPEVERLCDRVAVLAEGRLAAEGTVPDLLRRTGRATLEDAMLSLAGPGGTS